MRTTTLGDLITNVYATFERRYDAELAGVATAVTIDDLLRARRQRPRRSR